MCAAQKKECKKNVLFWCNVARSHNLNAMPHISLYFMSYVLFVQPQKGVQEDCFVLVQGRDMTHSKFHASHFPLCCVLLPAAKPRRSMDGKMSVGGTGVVHFLGIFCEIELKSNSDISN